MPIMISGETADGVWSLVAKQLKTSCDTVASRSGNTYELLHVLLSLDNPREKWVLNRGPMISISFALAEVVWILNGSNDAKVINYWNPPLSKYAGRGNQYHGAYGFRIRQNFKIDQLERAYSILHNNPDSRQVVMLIWDPIEDLPQDDGSPSNQDIPCNICSMLKVRDTKLEWTQIMRSNDVFRGLPYNIVQFTSMQEILAGWLGIDVGSYTHYSDSLHLYACDNKKMTIMNFEYSKNSDSLSVSKGIFDTVIQEIYSRMKTIVYTEINETILAQISELKSESEAYNNIMRIISAYIANKKGFLSLKNKIIEECSNPLYVEIWNQWEKNVQGGKSHE